MKENGRNGGKKKEGEKRKKGRAWWSSFQRCFGAGSAAGISQPKISHREPPIPPGRDGEFVSLPARACRSRAPACAANCLLIVMEL